ncbi:MAG: hypothetical protein ABSE07_05980 [Methanoregula sp.]|jgi:hypothetical protein
MTSIMHLPPRQLKKSETMESTFDSVICMFLDELDEKEKKSL